MNGYNPQALLVFSPGSLYGKLPPSANQPYNNVSAYRKASGWYEVHAPFGTHLAGIPGLSPRSGLYCLKDVYTIFRHLGAVLEVSRNHAGHLWQQFLDDQMEAFTTPGSVQQQAEAARMQFEGLADQLLVNVSAVLPKHRLRWSENPRLCRALSFRRDGLFLWPDWRSERWVNVTLAVGYDQTEPVRSMLRDWLQANDLTVVPAASH